MTIRGELEILGAERVRNAMVAFEHRKPGTGFDMLGDCPDRTPYGCCFLAHAHLNGEPMQNSRHWTDNRERLSGTNHDAERAFEGFERATVTREELRQECIAFLAEHGDTIEVAPKKSPRALRVAAVLCLLLIVLVV